MDVLVTVGMGPWPFDRLLRGVIPLCGEHRVFAQTGPSHVALPCASAPFITPEELAARIQNADVVITHAGNTVRLVQRANKVPIAVARAAARGEMPNDHQVEYLRHEQRVGRVVPAWDVGELPRLVSEHPSSQARLLAQRDLAPPIDPGRVRAVLDLESSRLLNNPFRQDPLRRYAFAWDACSVRSGRHLDVGCNTGTFVSSLAATTALTCHAVDPHPDYVRAVEQRDPRVIAIRVAPGEPLPYPDDHFGSVSLLDVLEHCPSESAMLAEVWRVLEPGGLLVLTVPARHWFSWLDPDNVKYRFPRLHRLVYSTRFGRQRYHDRFVDRSNGLLGEMSLDKHEHTNYRRSWLVGKLRSSGFAVVHEDGANLFWRWFQIPALLAGARLRHVCERAIWLDGELFKRANLFISARKEVTS